MNESCLESAETYPDFKFLWNFVQKPLKDFLVEVFLKFDKKNFFPKNFCYANYFWAKKLFVQNILKHILVKDFWNLKRKIFGQKSHLFRIAWNTFWFKYLWNLTGKILDNFFFFWGGGVQRCIKPNLVLSQIPFMVGVGGRGKKKKIKVAQNDLKHILVLKFEIQWLFFLRGRGGGSVS